MSTIVSDTEAILSGDLVSSPAAATSSRFSWSAAIAGAIAATAVTFLLVSLGSGIGLSVASPYGASPSATTLTLLGAVWLVFAQALGFACGGYLAGRMRAHFIDDLGDEGRFRDAAEGFLVWGLGVVVMALFVTVAGFYTAGTIANTTTGAAAGAALSNTQTSGNAGAATDTVGYFVDMLFRPAAAAPRAGTPTPPAPVTGNNNETVNVQLRAEVIRIVARAVAQGELSADDRTYLAQLVSQRTGLSQDEAQRRVTDVESRTREAVKQAADKAAKAGAFLAFWTFMSLLFGAAAATLAAMLGGESREDTMAVSPTIQPR